MIPDLWNASGQGAWFRLGLGCKKALKEVTSDYLEV